MLICYPVNLPDTVFSGHFESVQRGAVKSTNTDRSVSSTKSRFPAFDLIEWRYEMKRMTKCACARQLSCIP